MRIGVFICNCGGSLKNIDFGELRERVKRLPDVSYVDLSSSLCLKEGLEGLASAIKSEKLDRVVIAACSPALSAELFREAVAKAGLDPETLSIANIREGCSWAHEGDVTGKAAELIAMAVSRARLLKGIERERFGIARDVLVIGGGEVGMKTALRLSRLGLKVTMVEDGYKSEIKAEPGFRPPEEGRIEILTGASVAEVKGHVGDFRVRIETADGEVERRFGAIVLAGEGGIEALPVEFRRVPGVAAERELVEIIRHPERLPERPKTVVFILDAFGGGDRLAALSTLKNALAVKERLGSEVYVLCESLKVDAEGAEALYRRARGEGIVFLKFEGKPRVEPGDEGRVKVRAKDVLIGDEVEIEADLLVIAAGTAPPEGSELLNAELKVGVDGRGFVQDANVHLYPVFSRRKGIFLVGGCRGDLDPARLAADISSVAAEVHKLLSAEEITVEVPVKVDPDKCRTCLTCLRVCPHGAIDLVELEGVGQVAQVYGLACDRCGICAAFCPAKAIEFEGYEDDQIIAQLEAVEEGKVIAFCCAESAYKAADMAARLGMRYPAEVRVIEVPCAGRVDLIHILKAFERGASGVLIMGCPEGACHHLEGNIRARERVEYARKLLGEIGIDKGRVEMVNLGPDMAWRFVQEVSRMTEKAKEG